MLIRHIIRTGCFFFLCLVLQDLSTVSAVAQERHEFVGGTVSLVPPAFVLIQDDIPKVGFSSDQRSERERVLDEAYTLEVSYRGIADLRHDPPSSYSIAMRHLLEDNSSIGRDDLVRLYEGAAELPVLNSTSVITESLRHIERCDEKIGEFGFYAPVGGYIEGNLVRELAPVMFGYGASVIIDRGYAVLRFYRHDYPVNGYPLYSQLDDIFVERDGRYHWRSEDGPAQLYDLVANGRRGEVPEELVRLREAWETILSTLEVDCN